MLFTCIFLIASAFQTYEVYLLLSCFLKESKKLKVLVILSWIICFLMISIPYLVLNVPLVTLVFSYFGILLLAVSYEGSWKTKIIAATFAMGITVLAECLVAIISGYLHLELIHSNEYISLLSTVCLPIVEFVIVLIVRNFKHMREGENVSISYWAISVMLPILSICLFILFYIQPEIKTSDILICTVILFIINIFVFYLYDKQMQNFAIRQEKYELELQNQYQSNQLNLMHENVEKARSFRHDILKHISMISYLNDRGSSEELSDYLEEIQENVASGHKYVDTGNFVFDSILNYKIQESLEKDIHMEVQIKVPAELEVSTYDMNVILTNLLDNSIEAVQSIEDRRIDVEITYSKNRLNIRIQNPYGEVSQKNGKYITTKSDKDAHGYGLKNVQHIVEKYDGVMETSDKNGIFTVFICLFMK